MIPYTSCRYRIACVWLFPTLWVDVHRTQRVICSMLCGILRRINLFLYCHDLHITGSNGLIHRCNATSHVLIIILVRQYVKPHTDLYNLPEDAFQVLLFQFL